MTRSRVMFTTASGLGHIHPVIPLARAAEAAGDEVVFAVPAEAEQTIGRFGFRALTVPYGDPAEIGRAWSQLPREGLNTYVVADIFIGIHGRAARQAIQHALTEFGADLMISNDFAALVAAEVADVPSGFLGITALDLEDLDHARVIDAVDDLRQEAGLRRSGRMPYENGSRYLSAVPPLLWQDPRRLPADWIWFRHEDAEGPVRPVAPASTNRPRVYATLGSVAGANSFGRPVFHDLASALGRIEADVLLTVGPFETGQLTGVPPNVRIRAYEAQSVAMQCDVVVTHAGAGTTVAALSRGLPVVAVPMFADQMHNADRLATAGLGLRVDPGQLISDLPAAVEAVLTDPSYRLRARQVAAEIGARPQPAAALDLLLGRR